MPRFLILLLAIAALPAAADECYSVDPVSGTLSFELKQAGSPFRGAFRRFGGELCIAQGRVARIDVWLEPASVETGLPEIDAALKEREFFDVARHPRIAFAGESVQVRADRQIARGTLDVKGKRRSAEVPFRLGESGGKPVVYGAFTLNRLDYGIGTGEWSDTRWLGSEVKIDFSANLSRR
ncbi:MAG: YceI family protein [Betaproteobacteria bacterium]|nr:YceI family protein [Betaproteobacteria bacterium]